MLINIIANYRGLVKNSRGLNFIKLVVSIKTLFGKCVFFSMCVMLFLIMFNLNIMLVR